MDSDATLAFLESIKLINHNLEKITSRIEILENDYQYREAKKRFMKYLIAFYPLVITLLLLLINSDHNKIAQIAVDVSGIVTDAKTLTLLADNQSLN
jgi:tetrahydromethanopterin S-methyltransferase subunit G